ncbi:MAG: Kelch repeat-containing protein [Planctomycetota bacterium]
MKRVPALIVTIASSVAGLPIATAQSNPTVQAGIVEVIDHTSPTFSTVPIWNAGGLYVHQVGTAGTVEVTTPTGGAITNIRGIKSFTDATNPAGSSTWIWTGQAVYHRVPGTTTTTEITNPQGQSIADVRGVVGNPDASSPGGSSVWIWTPSAVYLHQVGTTTTVQITLSGGGAIAGVRGMLATNPSASPGFGQVWMWTASAVYRHAVTTTNVVQITSPSGTSIDNVRGMLISPDTGVTPTNYPVWIYNGAKLFFHAGAGNSTVEITHPGGSSLNDIQGMIYTEDVNSAGGYPVWCWTSYGVFLHLYGTTTSAELSSPGGGALASVRGMVAGEQAPGVSVPLLFNGAGAYAHQYGSLTTIEFEHPSGGSITNPRGILSAFDATSPIGYRRFIWNDTGVFLHTVGTTMTAEVSTPTGGALAGVRGVVASLDVSSASDTSIWIWNGAGVFKHVFGTLQTVEVTQPSGAPIANAWTVHDAYNFLTAGSSHWIRNSDGVFLHQFGTTSTVEIKRPNGTALTSPPYNAPQSSLALVRNSEYPLGGGGAAVGFNRAETPFAVDAWGNLVNAGFVPSGVPQPLDLTTSLAGSGSQAVREAGAFLWNSHESVLITQSPEVTTGACCIAGNCQVTTGGNCSLLGGQFQGNGTVCGPATCAASQCGGLCPPDIAWELAANSGPSPRWGHAMAYDALHQRTVLFGGGSPDDESWEFDGVAWSQRFPTASPPGRFRHEMVYDNDNDLTIMFGGWNSSSQFFNDTWAWDGNDWTQQFPAVSPPARIAFGMVYDSRRKVIVLFGGADAALNMTNETWEYSFALNTWNQRLPTSSPTARTSFGMAFDALRGVTVLQGGVTSNGGSDETWEYDGANWTLVAANPNPGPRNEHKMVYDSTRKVCVVYGGNNAGYTDVWEFDGDQWQNDSDNAPGLRPAPAMAFHEASNKTLMFGGSADSNTWSYPGTSTTQDFLVTGNPNGVGWSWGVAGPGMDVCDLTVPGVSFGLPLIELAWSFADSIDAAGCPGLAATAVEIAPNMAVLSVTTGGFQPFDVCVGSFGFSPGCCVATGGLCSFNPDIEPIMLSGEDCDANGMDDMIDLLVDGSEDENGNEIPDVCEQPAGMLPPTLLAEGGRYLGITVNEGLAEVAIRINGHPDDPQVACIDGYINPDGTIIDEPIYLPMHEWGTVHAHGSIIIPESGYLVTLESENGDVSAPAFGTTWVYGDVDGNSSANFADILLIVFGFQGEFSYAADLDPCDPNGFINFADILQGVFAFQGAVYEDMDCLQPCP